MAHSDSEDEVEAIDDLEFDNRSSDADEVIEEDAFGMEVDQEEATDGDDVRFTNIIYLGKLSEICYVSSMNQETGSDDDDDDDNDEEEEEEEERQPVHYVSVPPQPPASGLPSQQQSLKHVSPPQTKPEPDVITRQPSTTPGQNNSPRRESTSCNTSAFSQVICRLN